MANTNAPRGLRPLGITLSGCCPSIEKFKKVVGYGTAIFRNDAVNRVADGSIEASATPGTTLYSGVSLNHGAASKATEHLVITSPDALFAAQASGAFAEADEGLGANLVLTAGDATTKVSKHAVNSATQDGTTATLDVKLLRLLPTMGNEYGNYARIEVMFNKHRMAYGVAGV